MEKNTEKYLESLGIEFNSFVPKQKKEIITKESLSEEIRYNQLLFKKEIIDYLYSLLELEIPVLKKENNPLLIQQQLYKFDFYKRIVAYNILNRSFNLLFENKKTRDYIEKSNEELSLFYKTNLFQLTTDFKETEISIYKPKILTIDDIVKKEEHNKNKISEINKKLKELREKIKKAKAIDNSSIILKNEMMNPLIDEEDYSYPIYGPIEYSDEEILESKLNSELRELNKFDKSVLMERLNTSQETYDISEEIKKILFEELGLNEDKEFSSSNQKHLTKKYQTTTIHYYQ